MPKTHKKLSIQMCHTDKDGMPTNKSIQHGLILDFKEGPFSSFQQPMSNEIIQHKTLAMKCKTHISRVCAQKSYTNNNIILCIKCKLIQIGAHRPVIWILHLTSIKQDRLRKMTLYLLLIWCFQQVAHKTPEDIPLKEHQKEKKKQSHIRLEFTVQSIPQKMD